MQLGRGSRERTAPGQRHRPARILRLAARSARPPTSCTVAGGLAVKSRTKGRSSGATSRSLLRRLRGMLRPSLRARTRPSPHGPGARTGMAYSVVEDLRPLFGQCSRDEAAKNVARCYASYPGRACAMLSGAPWPSRRRHRRDHALREAGGRFCQQFQRLQVLQKQLQALSPHAGQASRPTPSGLAKRAGDCTC